MFGAAKPGTVVVTTPNAEYNVRFPTPTVLRHPDHRFEWDRADVRRVGGRHGERFGYTVRCHPVGDDDPEVGPPTQLAEFTKVAS